jgi:hypothetical protein
MLGVCWMLLWLGVSDVWQRRSFWTAENLMASAFYGEGAIRSGFAGRTLSGLALYLILYSLLGALLAAVIGGRMPRMRVFLVSLLFAVSWYYLSFRLLWTSLLPLVALLHSAQATSLGHLIYGAVLGRYPAYLPAEPVTAAPTPQDPPLAAQAEIEAPTNEPAPSEAESEAHQP